MNVNFYIREQNSLLREHMSIVREQKVVFYEIVPCELRSTLNC
jgi:hypothetical protein